MSFLIEEVKIPKQKKPEWLKAKVPGGENFIKLKKLMSEKKLHSVCEEAHCPNLGECWNSGTATFMILGDICTRSCGFCAVKTGSMGFVDKDEPRRVGEAIASMNLKHAVITSVNRDELYDGGAEIFANTILEIKKRDEKIKIEVLIPDFQGSNDALNILLNARPDILNHNIETVPRLYKTVRPQAHYHRSLELLDRAYKKNFVTKSGIMVGLGENNEEIIETLSDLRAVNCQIVTIGQYLQPSQEHLKVERFVHPDDFKMFKKIGLEMGFRHVESGPLVRSSYHAAEHIK